MAPIRTGSGRSSPLRLDHSRELWNRQIEVEDCACLLHLLPLEVGDIALLGVEVYTDQIDIFALLQIFVVVLPLFDLS